MTAAKRCLVTGGTGFIGSALVRALVRSGYGVRVLDNDSRGSPERLRDVLDDVELVRGDVRDRDRVARAVAGVDTVCHLAAVNGTENFYSRPQLVLEVGVKGILNVIDACMAGGVPELMVASSSEVYQQAQSIPTPEEVPLQIPDPMNPRYSYAGSKIISELLAINYGRAGFSRVTIVRPHNVYGPDMGWEHVVPQLAVRLFTAKPGANGAVRLPIEGTGEETRAFAFIEDAIAGILKVLDRGEHLGIYNVGTDEEITIASLARRMAECAGVKIALQPGEAKEGGARRRCPDIARLRALGYSPMYSLTDGLSRTIQWYRSNLERRPAGE